jgi:hypothetical protein
MGMASGTRREFKCQQLTVAQSAVDIWLGGFTRLKVVVYTERTNLSEVLENESLYLIICPTRAHREPHLKYVCVQSK